MAGTSYSNIRKRLLAITATIVVICLLAIAGISQMAKVAHFHELNALHLRATDALRSLLRASTPALPEIASLRSAVANVRTYSAACLSEIGFIERVSMTVLGQELLIALCEDDVAQADRTLALIDDYVRGGVDARRMRSQIEAATIDFVGRSDEFIAPVAAVGSAVLRSVLTGMILSALLTVAIVAGIVSRVSDAVKQLHNTNESLAMSEQRNRQLAMYDSLTGLPNRNLFVDRLDQGIACALRGQHAMSLLFIDLDRFKDVNDSLGHDAGDELLTVVGSRLQSIVRDSDTVARLGGDEFAIILSRVSHAGDAALVAQHALEVLGVPIALRGVDNQIGASIGITLCPQDGVDGSSLLKHADLAMYDAKARGRNGYRFFAHGSDESARQRVHNEQLLRHAAAQGQLRLHYQPIVRLQDGSTVGAEALLRWQHPEDGLVYPDNFITQAEDCGAIGDIGRWVLDAALTQCAAWRAHNPDFIMAINVSVRQLRDPAIVGELAGLLSLRDIPPRNVHLEVTESIFLDGEDEAVNTLHLLGEMGVALSIDDFGTGYSSFGYLHKLPFGILKIDRSFIRNLPESRDATAVAAAIAGMAASLDLDVVAEGIENERQYAFLKSLDCAMGQGYFFSRPVSAEEFSPLRQFAARRAPQRLA